MVSMCSAGARVTVAIPQRCGVNSQAAANSPACCWHQNQNGGVPIKAFVLQASSQGCEEQGHRVAQRDHCTHPE